MQSPDRRSRRELGLSGGIPTAIAYAALALCTGLAGELWPRHAVGVVGVVLLMLFTSVVREMVGRKLVRCSDEQLATYHTRYSAMVLVQALLWSGFASAIVFVYGKTWTGLVAILVTGGILAGATASLTPNYFLMRVYIALINLPVALAMVSHGTRGEVAVALTLVLYSYFMLRIGARNSSRYHRLVSALGQLAKARSNSEQLAADLRHLAAAQQNAVERERLHLAREVHDDFGQLLTALKISLARLEKHIPQEEGLNRLSEINSLVDTTMAAARRISSSLRPPLLDELGLAPAIDRFLSESCQRAELDYRMDLASPLPILTPDQSLAAFRVCQEAVTNILRHSKARTVTVELAVCENYLSVRVSDDGVGMPPERSDSSSGLMGLKERLHLLGGELQVTSQVGTGTQISAFFPLQIS